MFSLAGTLTSFFYFHFELNYGKGKRAKYSASPDAALVLTFLELPLIFLHANYQFCSKKEKKNIKKIGCFPYSHIVIVLVHVTGGGGGGFSDDRGFPSHLRPTYCEAR